MGLALAPASASALPAFPGAQGFGAVATGGRGGQPIIVTTLAESGPGSLREALETPGPRIIVFAVSGVIDLGEPNADDPFDESDSNNVLTIAYGDVTIAGQTAPGAGITIRGRLYAAYDESVSNVILRHVRIRPAPFPGGDGGEQYDALRFSLNSQVIVDHVSVSFGVDENVDMYEGSDITVQWSAIEESATDGHPEGEHNYGVLNMGGRISVHHVLFAHNRNRNPALAVGPAESINNVAYNVRHGFVNHNDAAGEISIVGNTFVQGPDDTLIPLFSTAARTSATGSRTTARTIRASTPAVSTTRGASRTSPIRSVRPMPFARRDRSRSPARTTSRPPRTTQWRRTTRCSSARARSLATSWARASSKR